METFMDWEETEENGAEELRELLSEDAIWSGLDDWLSTGMRKRETNV